MKPYVPDTPPAKLWELLRRNARFRRTVGRLLALESDSQSCDPCKRERATGRAERILSHVERKNPCAETALRWLVFPPLFIRRVIACEAGREADLAAGRPVMDATVQIGWGRHPQESLETPWITFSSQIPTASDGLDSAEGRASAHGWPRCLGPQVETVTSDDSRLQHKCRDAIAEWSAHFADGRRFTFDTPWPDTPAGFQRTFGAHWLDFCGKGRIAETNFFQEWDLASLVGRAAEAVKAANRLICNAMGDLDRVRRGKTESVCPPVPTKGGNSMRVVPQVEFRLTEAERHRLFLFGDLASHRIFALPHLLTREDVEPVLKKLKRQLLHGLPDARELLGTPEFWKDFGAVDSIARAESIDVGLAIRRHIYRSPETMLALRKDSGLAPEVLERHFRHGTLIEPSPDATAEQRTEWATAKSRIGDLLREVNQRERTTIKRRVEFMGSLVGASFVRLEPALLFAKPPHKRTRKR